MINIICVYSCLSLIKKTCCYSESPIQYFKSCFKESDLYQIIEPNDALFKDIKTFNDFYNFYQQRYSNLEPHFKKSHRMDFKLLKSFLQPLRSGHLNSNNAISLNMINQLFQKLNDLADPKQFQLQTQSYRQKIKLNTATVYNSNNDGDANLPFNF